MSAPNAAAARPHETRHEHARYVVRAIRERTGPGESVADAAAEHLVALISNMITARLDGIAPTNPATLSEALAELRPIYARGVLSAMTDAELWTAFRQGCESVAVDLNEGGLRAVANAAVRHYLATQTNHRTP